jgi:hypothetical protein
LAWRARLSLAVASTALSISWLKAELRMLRRSISALVRNASNWAQKTSLSSKLARISDLERRVRCTASSPKAFAEDIVHDAIHSGDAGYEVAERQSLMRSTLHVHADVRNPFGMELDFQCRHEPLQDLASLLLPHRRADAGGPDELGLEQVEHAGRLITDQRPDFRIVAEQCPLGVKPRQRSSVNSASIGSSRLFIENPPLRVPPAYEQLVKSVAKRGGCEESSKMRNCNPKIDRIGWPIRYGSLLNHRLTGSTSGTRSSLRAHPIGRDGEGENDEAPGVFALTAWRGPIERGNPRFRPDAFQPRRRSGGRRERVSAARPVGIGPATSPGNL